MKAPQRVPTELHGRVVAGTFVPHPLARNAHVQTLLPRFRPTPRVALRVERLELPDGDFVDLGWCEQSRGHGPLPHGPLPHGALPHGALPHGALPQRPPQQAMPLAVLLHGLTGGFDSKYVRGTARQLLRQGWRVVILQFRGAGLEPNRLPRHYHHGDTQDLRELLALLHAREPQTPLFTVGWSLGANVMLKYLGEDGARAPVTAAVAVCAPFQLQPCAERLRTGFSRLYQRHLLGELQRMIQRKHEVTPLPIDIEKVARARDFFDFDSAATAVLNGFRDAEDYYARASSARYLGGITVPVLAIHAKDDPFMTPEIVPDAAHLPPSMTLELCEHGGHVGFCAAGPRLRPHWWLEDRIPEFLMTHAR